MASFLDVYDNPNNMERYNRVMDIINNDLEIGKIFSTKKDRFMLVQHTYLITYNGEDAGFINLLYEQNYTSFMVLDRGVVEKYRYKGIGTLTLQFLKRKILKIL